MINEPDDIESRDQIGREIFNLIKPLVAEYDKRMARIIPERTISQLREEFADDESFKRLFDLDQTSNSNYQDYTN